MNSVSRCHEEPTSGREGHRSAQKRNASSPRRAAGGLFAQVLRACRWSWFLLVRNRFAIAVASLLWLIFRSGSQPRRITYPCQQVAAANVGAFAAGLIPVLWLSRKRRCSDMLPRAAVIRRQLLIAGIMFVVALIGVETYQFANTPGECGPVPMLPGTQTPAANPTTVAVVKDRGHVWPIPASQVEAMVRRAVMLAGGFQDKMVDGNGGGSVDGILKVVIKPNLVQDLWVPGDGVTTDPKVTRAVVRIAEEAALAQGWAPQDIQIFIAEGSASSRGSIGVGGRLITRRAFHDSGYTSEAWNHTPWQGIDDETGAKLVDLNDCGTGSIDPSLDPPDPNLTCQEATVSNGVIRTEYWMQDILMDCDVLISVPTLKNHANGSVTMSLKNRVGCAPSDIYHHPSFDQMKWGVVHSTNDGFGWTVAPAPSGIGNLSEEDEIVQRTIVDLNLLRPQDFAVIDGLMGIENGPVGPNNGGGGAGALMQREMDLVIAGRDSVAVDAVGSLVMGYDPDYIPHIAWADGTGALGTGNRSVIQVLGDHVAVVREDFAVEWDAWCQQARAESDSPWLTDISWAEGAPVTILQDTTVWALGSGDSGGVTSGLVKAELTIRPAPEEAPAGNLLINGGFETGDGTGWTTWESPWGSNMVRLYDYHAGCLGDHCLRLGNTDTTGSFGVYQEVAVEPGKTYRIDMDWKGYKYGNLNWWEVILIDGPFDYNQADQADLVERNYMYAYDNNTYALPIGYFGWIWGHEQNAPPENQVDWNNRKGCRTATGNVMTVVLKAGSDGSGSPGVAAWLDGVSLVEVTDVEPVVTRVNPPVPDFSLVWDSTSFAPGDYQATVTIYDASMNEASITRNIELVPPEGPILSVGPLSMSASTFVGDDPEDDTFTVGNAGVETLNYTLEVSEPWLELSAWGGSVPTGAPPDTITVYFHCSALLPGQHEATITVSCAEAYNSPKEILVTVDVGTVICDFAPSDGDVDMEDFGYLQACYTGPGNLVTDPSCFNADIHPVPDGDGDVDIDDFNILQGCLTGAKIIPDPDCAGSSEP